MAKILIVDDDNDFVNLAKLYLTQKEHEVYSAKDAFEANDMLDKYKPDIALIDVNMPYTNGFDFVKNLKRTIRHRFLPVVFVTARSSKTDVERAIGLEANGYIIKPIQKEDFVEKVEGFLSSSPKKQTISIDVDKNSQIFKSELMVKLPVTIISVFETGIIVEIDRELGNDDVIELKSILFSAMNIPNCQFKVLMQKKNEASKSWRTHLMFHQISQESLANVREYLQNTARSGGIIK